MLKISLNVTIGGVVRFVGVGVAGPVGWLVNDDVAPVLASPVPTTTLGSSADAELPLIVSGCLLSLSPLLSLLCVVSRKRSLAFPPLQN